MTRYGLKDTFRLYVLPLLLGWIVRIWFITVRVEIRNKEIYDKYLLDDKGRDIILGIWHRNIIYFAYFFGNLKNKITLVSASHDGDIAAGLAPRFGYKPIRGSAYRKGARALIALITEMRKSKEKCICFTAIDGSRKPARIAEKGMVFLAKKTGALIAPVSFSGTNLITFHKAWDKTILPRPFSKVVVDLNQPIEVPPKASEDELEQIRREVEGSLNDLTDRVDRVCGYTDPTSASV